MKKGEFIRLLVGNIPRSVPEDERSEIISDYEEHFMMGLAAGRTEDDISEKLGDPRALAKEYGALSLVRIAEERPSARGIGRAILATIGLGIFNLIVVLAPLFILLLILFLIFFLGFFLLCTGPVMIGFSVLALIGFINSGVPVSPLAGICFGIGLSTSGLFLLLFCYWLIRTFYRIGIRYLKWNIAVISGRDEL